VESRFPGCLPEVSIRSHNTGRNGRPRSEIGFGDEDPDGLVHPHPVGKAPDALKKRWCQLLPLARQQHAISRLDVLIAPHPIAKLGDADGAAQYALLGIFARLERARLEALHAADAAVLEMSSLPADGEQLLGAHFTAHPALRLVASNHPIVTIWLTNQTDESAANILARRETALVTRPDFQVNTLLLDEPAGIFASALLNGSSVQDAYARVAAVFADFDIGAAFSGLFEAGAFCACSQFNRGEL